MTPIRDSTVGLIRAAAAPWARRAPTSTDAVGATPQSADAAAKAPSPTENTRRRPKRSARRPALIISTAKLIP